MRTQRYVSDELTHFVGRSIVEHEEMYRRLHAILESGELRPNLVGQRGGEVELVATAINPEADLSEMFISEVVCFCDIPAPCSTRNCLSNASPNGPYFLMCKPRSPANPVLYLAEEAKAYGEEDNLKDAYQAALARIIRELPKTLSESKGKTQALLVRMQSFLFTKVFPLIKRFTFG